MTIPSCKTSTFIKSGCENSDLRIKLLGNVKMDALFGLNIGSFMLSFVFIILLIKARKEGFVSFAGEIEGW